jgi:hypothetical protein
MAALTLGEDLSAAHSGFLLAIYRGQDFKNKLGFRITIQ